MKSKLTFLPILIFGLVTIQIFSKQENKVQRCSSYPFISGDAFRTFCDFIIDKTNCSFNPDALQDGDTIFLKTDYLAYFFKVFHPRITKKYILVTHNSDLRAPGKFASFLNDKKLIAWFGQNVCQYHPKLIPIPIGLANSHFLNGNISIITDIESHQKIKDKLLYLNISGTHHERRKVEQIFSGKPFCFKSNRKPFKSYLEDLASSFFVLSPRGKGEDCYRTWETLLCGSFPVVRHSTIDKLFTDLPVVIINDWEEITESFLHNKLKEFSLKEFRMEKLYADYWLELIRNIQRQYK